jgi:HD superfamily phosphohydrolase
MKIFKGNSIYSEVIESPEFQRLKDISFLGILGYVCLNRNSYSTRYEHSISVANKCLVYAKKKMLPKFEEIYFVLAGLLHDLGHCSFSHSLEPVFINKFSISHHDVTNHLILYSPHLMQIWNKHNINANKIIDTIEGRANPRDNVITKMSTNFDAIDGIVRTESFFSNSNYTKHICDQVFNIICNEENWEKHAVLFDSFWESKDRIYNSYIYDEKSRIAESLFQALFLKEPFLSKDHFLLTDSEMLHIFPWLCRFINDFRSDFSTGFVADQLKELNKIGDVVGVNLRSFRINFDKKFSVSKNQRYFIAEENSFSYI